MNRNHLIIHELQNLGIPVIQLLPELTNYNTDDDPDNDNQSIAVNNFSYQLSLVNPDLVLINQGVNFDGLEFANCCRIHDLSYFIISHKSIEFIWPREEDRKKFSLVWQKSLTNYFVSDSNFRVTSEQFGMKIPKVQRAYYPIAKLKTKSKLPDSKEIRFACIGRLYLLDKGQDMLLRILSKPVWRERNIKVSVIGSGPDEIALKELAQYYNLSNVEFLGHIKNDDIWDNFHGLLLPSRNEGFPLVVQEAMAASRLVVVTTAGGSQEIIEDGKNGFISKCFQSDFELAMERCWQCQDDWDQIAQNAYYTINNYLPTQPTSNILELIFQILNEK